MTRDQTTRRQSEDNVLLMILIVCLFTVWSADAPGDRPLSDADLGRATRIAEDRARLAVPARPPDLYDTETSYPTHVVPYVRVSMGDDRTDTYLGPLIQIRPVSTLDDRLRQARDDLIRLYGFDGASR